MKSYEHSNLKSVTTIGNHNTEHMQACMHTHTQQNHSKGASSKATGEAVDANNYIIGSNSCNRYPVSHDCKHSPITQMFIFGGSNSKKYYWHICIPVDYFW